MIAFFAPGPMELLVVLFLAVIAVLPFWMIASKAGFPGWISLAILIPVLNIIFLFYLAFAEWPALRRLSGNDDHNDT